MDVQNQVASFDQSESFITTHNYVTLKFVNGYPGLRPVLIERLYVEDLLADELDEGPSRH